MTFGLDSGRPEGVTPGNLLLQQVDVQHQYICLQLLHRLIKDKEFGGLVIPWRDLYNTLETLYFRGKSDDARLYVGAALKEKHAEAIRDLVKKCKRRFFSDEVRPPRSALDPGSRS